MSNINSAYNFSAFEEKQPKKQKRIIKFPYKKQKRRVIFRTKMALIASFASISFVAIAVSSFFIYGQVTLTELTEEIENLSKKLDESESVYTQLKMKKDANNSLNSTKQAKENIDKYILNNNGVLKDYVPKQDVAKIN